MSNDATPMEGAPLIKPSTTDHPLYDTVVEACRTVYDPEIPVNIYDLGLVYTIDITPEAEVNVVMTLTAPGCPVAGEMPGWVADAVEPLPGVKQVNVEITWNSASCDPGGVRPAFRSDGAASGFLRRIRCRRACNALRH